MIYIDTKSTDCFYNFGAEYYFSREKRLDGDVFMLWRTTPTLMIGRFQNTLEEIDGKYARERGIKVVRRLSGGGTIYTDLGGWQFTYITESRGIEIDFRRFVDPIVEILRSLGVEAALTGRNDITICGKKVSGNTQYRLGGMTVHHGSLLFESDLCEIARATTPNPYKITSKAISSVRERVGNIRDYLPCPMTSEEFAAAVKSALTEEEYVITPEDNRRIRTIAREKFMDERAIYSTAPRFEIEKVLHLRGGTVNVSYSVKGGVIVEAGISGDFFSTVDISGIEAALVGCDFTPECVQASLEAVCGGIYEISAAELTRGIFE